MTKPNEIFQGNAFGGNKKLFTIVPVQLRLSFVKHLADAQLLQLRPGDHVIVETGRGPAIAKVTAHMERRVLAADEVIQVIRKATDEDVQQADRNEDLEAQAYHFCVDRVKARDLPMKVVRAHVMQDGSRIVVYFSSDGRIDFRDLVKDLAHRFRTRIEMHQIGVRDGTRMIGGIGPCGRELCCSSFLENFAPVSIRMAKDQGLTLNPAKVSGMCGRLMCCLVYEQAVYRRMKKTLPRAGKDVMTPDGPGKVIGLDVVNQRVQVQLEDTNRRYYRADDVAQAEPTQSPIQKAPTNYIWDEETVEDEAKSVETVVRRRRSDRSKSKSDAKAKADKPKTDKPKADKPNPEADTSDKPRRRRRRRRSSKDKTDSKPKE